MTQPRQILQGLDALLQEQALEMATLRAARNYRRTMKSDRTPKCYRVGFENPDGTWSVDVADRGADNWRERETCPDLDVARKRVQQLTAEDMALLRGVSTPDSGEPRT